MLRDAEVVLVAVQLLPVVVGVYGEGTVDVVVPEPILDPLDVPSLLDQHGRAGMAELVERDLRPAELRCRLVEHL